MDRRKDTPGKPGKLPRDYLKMIEEIFNKNFKKELVKTSAGLERFIVYGEIYPDEVLIAIALKNPDSLRMNTCYASVDYPLAQTLSTSKQSTADLVQNAVNLCIDTIGGYFDAYFEENRPLDYDVEYSRSWVPLEIGEQKKQRVFLRINRDNLDLEEEANAILAKAGMGEHTEPKPKKKKSKKALH